LLSVIFYGCMLSSSIEPKHLNSFLEVLHNVESFDIEGKEWVIDSDNILRGVNSTGSFDRETCWGKLSFIDDWFLERVELQTGSWSPSLSTVRSNYRKRRKPLASLYSIGHRHNERIFSRPGGPRLAKRRKLSSVNPWTGYIISYLEGRRESRTLVSPRYDPTALDVEKILLAAAPFVQTRKRQLEELCCQGPLNQRLQVTEET
jgi:hypothetical protein